MLMRQMRQNTKIIMLVTAAAFVALMVFEWGMDMSGQSGGGGDLGRVGNYTVSVQEWQNSYRQIYDRVSRTQDEPISTQQNREIEDMAWDEIVNQILIQMELDRRGIRVTDEEIRQAARFAPPPEFRTEPAFQTDGQFDFEKYHAFLNQAAADPVFLRQLENYYREMIPREKLVRQVTAGIYVSDAELWRQWRDEQERVVVSYLSLNPRERVPASQADVTRDEVQRFYRDNRDDFAVPARAEVRYVYLTKAPTAADSAGTRDRAEAIRQELLDGADFGNLAQLESADQGSAQQGGELPPFGRGQMVEPFEEAAFSLPIGEISEPVRSQFGYHVIEVLSREDDQVEARHILIPFERSDEAEMELLARADSLEGLGRNLTVREAAEHMNLSVAQGEITEEFALLPGVGQAREGQDWIFEDREGAGAVSPVFETGEAFYMLEILRESPAGYLPLEDVAGEIEELLRFRKQLERTQEEARGMAAELRGGSTTLEALAERIGTPLGETAPFNRLDFVPGLGTENAAIGTAFGTAPGSIGGPVRAGDRVLLLRVEEKVEADREDWEAQKEIQRQRVVAQLRQSRLDQWLEGLRETTRIQDRRAQFFRLQEEMADRPQIPLAF